MAATIIFLAVLALLWSYNIAADTRQAGQQVSESLSRVGQASVDELQRLSRVVDPENYMADAGFRAGVNADIYRFLADQKHQGVFTALSGDRLLFSTDDEASATVMAHIKWRMAHRVKDAEGPVIDLMRSADKDDADVQLVVAQSVKDKAGHPLAIISFSWPAYALQDLLGSLPVNVVITDPFGRVYAESGPLFRAPLGKVDPALRLAKGFVLLHGEPYFIANHSAIDGYLTVHAVSPIADLVTTLLMMTGLAVAVFVAITLAIMYSARRISRSKTKVINDMAAAFALAKEGNLHTRLEAVGTDEFAIIADAFNTMLDSIDDLMLTNAEQARETVLSKIKQLEAEFNPHFMFNTLETIRFMIKRDPEVASHMILKLSQLLRYSIKDSADIVPLGEDMAYIEGYLSILKERFTSRLSYDLRIPDQYRDCLIPRLIAQPIIENAVRYGLEGGRGALRLKVRLFQSGSKLVLTVWDNGPGIAPVLLNKLTADMAAKPMGNRQHIGLNNAHRRLQLMFGQQAGLIIRSTEGKGTAVHIVFPMTRRETLKETPIC